MRFSEKFWVKTLNTLFISRFISDKDQTCPSEYWGTTSKFDKLSKLGIVCHRFVKDVPWEKSGPNEQKTQGNYLKFGSSLERDQAEAQPVEHGYHASILQRLSQFEVFRGVRVNLFKFVCYHGTLTDGKGNETRTHFPIQSSNEAHYFYFVFLF